MDKLSQLFFKTKREDPRDEIAINAKLLERGGFIDKLMAGSYTLLPFGRIIESKIEQIIREEINKTGAQEILMPLLHPKEIWNETGRWDSAKEVMYQFKKDDRDYALSFTHEEIIIDLLRKHIDSYKDFPVKIYQFSTKFRNELRAKSGILRGREFLMKDLYSAHTSQEDLMDYYQKVIDAYIVIFKRIGLEIVVTEAAGGVFTDNHTHEFQLISDVGEDTIYRSSKWKYAKNQEIMTDEDFKQDDIEKFSSIELGNIFPLDTRYSEKMNLYFTDKDGEKKPVWFGSYGIGLTRLIGAIVEVSHDEKGIIWPKSIAPYDVVIVDLLDEPNHPELAKLIKELEQNNQDILLDDREISAGAKLNDADLVGIPLRIVISKRSLESGGVAVKKRNEPEESIISINEINSYSNKA